MKVLMNGIGTTLIVKRLMKPRKMMCYCFGAMT